MKGCDLNTIVTPDTAACLRANDYRFVGRYLKHAASCLTRPEALTISQAGSSVVLIVEAGYPTTAGYFSHAKGLEDGAFAYNHAAAMAVPAGAALYFAVDFDPSPAEVQGPVTAYFTGLNEAFHTAAFDHPVYPLGVYGSGLVCATLAQQTPVAFTWLAMSRGWRGSKSYTGWNLQQTVGARVCGVSVDENESNGAGGGFRLT
jgi:hypothetical protein